MQLIYLSNARLPTEQAHGYQITKMCEAFAVNGNLVRLIHPYRKQPKPFLKESVFSYYNVQPVFDICTFSGIYNIKGFQFVDPKLETCEFRLQSITHALNTIRATYPYWRNSEVLYFSRDLYSVFPLLGFRHFIKGKIIFEAHTFPESKLKFFLSNFRKLDALITINDQLKRLFVKAGLDEEKILVAHDAVDLENFDLKVSQVQARTYLGLPEKIKIAAYVGRFHTLGMEKGIPEILRSARNLVDKYPDLFFYFVGGPLERVPSYEKIIKEEKLQREKFIFLDKQPIHQVPYYLKASDVLLMPHPWKNFYAYYVSPLKLFEYMSTQRPIVASKLPSIMEILRDKENALLGEPDNPNAVAMNIQTALEDMQLAERIAIQAYADVQEHTWKKRAKKISNFLAERS
jgi:glycosyltransferase involved in cell wall biosynthesis